MRLPNNADRPAPSNQRNDWVVAIAIALSIFICLAAFIWIFTEIEPFMSDFTGTDSIATPDSATPLASPAAGANRPD